MNDAVRLIPPSKIGKGIIHVLENAKEHVILVSPYCNFLKWKQFTNAIEKCIDRGTEVFLFTREVDSPYENESINFLIKAGVHVYLIKSLHSKLYMNEKEAVITSLNLLYSSVSYSIEVGCFTTKTSILVQLHKSYFEEFEKIGRCISYKITFSIDPSAESIFDYFPDLISDKA